MKRILLAILILFILGLLTFSFLIISGLLPIVDPVHLLNLFLGVGILFLLGTLGLIGQEIAEQRKNLLLTQEKYALEINLQEEKKRFETIFELTHTGIALLNLDGRLLRVNQCLCELLGYTEAELLTLNFYFLVRQTDLNDMQIYIQQLIDQKIKVYQAEQQCMKKNGDPLWIMTTLSLIHDNISKPIYFILQVQNITLQKKAEESLRHMAYHDALTGLANRNKLEQFMIHELASARRHQRGFALLFLDLDRFKAINDTIGHEAGDLLLQIIAERLHSAVRVTDMVARLGGDEFVLLITDVKKTESVALIAQKILHNVLQVIMIKGQEIYITTSIGISLYPYDGQTIQALMKNADLALYRAKEQGRNNYQFYTLEMTGKAQEKLALQNALAHALVKNEFVLNYHPKMNIQTRQITGIEALLRWKNKDYGMITPDEIVILAEETGLIIPVSDWILQTACQQLKIWHDAGFSSLTMAVNCSVRQFKQMTLVDNILQIITNIGIPPMSLEIEVTEKIIMEDPENMLRGLYALKDLGVQIAIDDFGTGYWSLSNLRKLSVDKIKIDKTFIKQITSDETSASITRAIIAMANQLDVKSIAEGVETREQYLFLAQEGCTEIQGYYLTQPLSDEAMTRFLKHPIPDAEAIKNEMTE